MWRCHLSLSLSLSRWHRRFPDGARIYSKYISIRFTITSIPWNLKLIIVSKFVAIILRNKFSVYYIEKKEKKKTSLEIAANDIKNYIIFVSTVLTGIQICDIRFFFKQTTLVSRFAEIKCCEMPSIKRGTRHHPVPAQFFEIPRPNKRRFHYSKILKIFEFACKVATYLQRRSKINKNGRKGKDSMLLGNKIIDTHHCCPVAAGSWPTKKIVAPSSFSPRFSASNDGRSRRSFAIFYISCR